MNEPTPHYPLFLDLAGRRAVVVGGGSVAARKAAVLVRHGATVVLVAPEAGGESRRMASSGGIRWETKRFEPPDLDGAAIAFAATDDATVNAAVAAAARERGIPVNVADAPALGDFFVPAVVEAGPIRIAISTDGRSPALARKLRQEIEELVGPAYGEMAEILGALREPAIEAPGLPSDADRRRFFESVLDAGVLELLRQGRRTEAYAAVTRLCEGAGVAVPSLLLGRTDSP